MNVNLPPNTQQQAQLAEIAELTGGAFIALGHHLTPELATYMPADQKKAGEWLYARPAIQIQYTDVKGQTISAAFAVEEAEHLMLSLQALLKDIASI